MSGTSLDGVDLAVCEFTESEKKWTYEILFAETYPYSIGWKEKLSHAFTLSGNDVICLDREYGQYLGELINKKLASWNVKPELVASHGHTVFHNPASRYTLQIGHGGVINSITNIPVVCDFRSADVALGGQGAPLVPVGDKILFGEFDACLNLGGFANISFDFKGNRRAFDICPVNIVLNEMVRIYDKEFDDQGGIGRQGKSDVALLKVLNGLPFYQYSFPKSLGREWVEDYFTPIVKNSTCSEYNKLATVYHHIAFQISEIVKKYPVKNILVTGGGAKNTFLLELIRQYSEKELIVPQKEIVDFKEALVFAFLGLLNVLGEVNCYSSVTGASRDSIAGAYYGAKNMKVGDSPLS